MKASYTLVQLIPDELRDERINVAIILQCTERRFARMRVRKYMDSHINAIFPDLNAQVVRLITQGISRHFKSLRSDILFEDLDSSREEFIRQFSHDYGIIRFSEAKKIVVKESDDLEERAEKLFARLVQSQYIQEKPDNITKDLLTDVVTEFLTLRRVPIDKDPPPYKGQAWVNRFDALHSEFNRRHLHFISFDLLEAPYLQAKAFIQSVIDMKSSDSYQEDDFACIVQPPRINRSIQSDFEDAVRVFRNNDVHTFTNETNDLERLVSELSDANGFNPISHRDGRTPTL